MFNLNKNKIVQNIKKNSTKRIDDIMAFFKNSASQIGIIEGFNPMKVIAKLSIRYNDANITLQIMDDEDIPTRIEVNGAMWYIAHFIYGKEWKNNEKSFLKKIITNIENGANTNKCETPEGIPILKENLIEYKIIKNILTGGDKIPRLIHIFFNSRGDAFMILKYDFLPNTGESISGYYQRMVNSLDTNHFTNIVNSTITLQGNSTKYIISEDLNKPNDFEKNRIVIFPKNFFILKFITDSRGSIINNAERCAEVAKEKGLKVGNFIPITTEEDCRSAAESQGLTPGKGNTPFANNYSIKGCYAYKSGGFTGSAFWGNDPNKPGEYTSDLDLNQQQIRVYSSKEEDGNMTPLRGDDNIKGCFAYNQGDYMNRVFFGTGGTTEENGAEIQSTDKYRISGENQGNLEGFVESMENTATENGSIGNLCPDGFKQTPEIIGDSLQVCKSKVYLRDCILNDESKNGLPRCYNENDETLSSANYIKECKNIPGMKLDGTVTGAKKCITNTDYLITGTSTPFLEENELRECYIHKNGLDPNNPNDYCDPKKGKETNEDCLCKFEVPVGEEGVPVANGKAIIEDSFCKTLDDNDLTYGECVEYARWEVGGDENPVTSKFFNDDFTGIDTQTGSVIGGFKKGCQRTSNKGFVYVDPNERYGESNRNRKWYKKGGNESERDEITRLYNTKVQTKNSSIFTGGNEYENICKSNYNRKKNETQATEMIEAETEVVKLNRIPGITSNDQILQATPYEVSAQKTVCNAANPPESNWDSCYMAGDIVSLNTGKERIPTGYLEYTPYIENTENTENTEEGFVGFREGFSENTCLTNCVPATKMSGNCDEDIKVTRDMNNIQRFFKLCPHECLTSIDGVYQDISDNPGVCKNSRQCRESCNKTAVQIKHVYENRCKDGETCDLAKMKTQYEEKDGKIKYDKNITITEIPITDTIINRYENSKTNPGDDSFEHIYFSIIEELKKKAETNILGISYQSIPPSSKDPNKNLLVIYEKKNREANITTMEPGGDNGTWVTYIHNRNWKDYWYDPNATKWTDMGNELTSAQMARMQGLDLGISNDGFETIPTYWDVDNTKTATSEEICGFIDDKIAAGELTNTDNCNEKFRTNWDARTIGIGKTPSSGLKLEEFEQVFNLSTLTQEASPYRDATNPDDFGEKDLSLDDYYKRRLLSSSVENRLGGSTNAYTKTYKPLNPNAKPRFFNSVWGLFH